MKIYGKKSLYLKILILFIGIILIFCVLASCEEKNNSQNITGTNNSETTEEYDSTTQEFKPDFPSKNMNGSSVTIIAPGWNGYTGLNVIDICPDEITGEVLNDAAYERKLKIEEQFNCKFFQTDIQDLGSQVQQIKRAVMAEDKAYDIAIVRGASLESVFAENILFNIKELPYINIDNPWWDKNLINTLSIAGKSLGISGNITSTELMPVNIVTFNKQIIIDYKLESPYELVKNGDWIFDKMIEMAKAVAHDIDGDGIMTAADMWGIMYMRDCITGILNSCGVKLAEIDAEGIPRINVDNESNITKIYHIYSNLFNFDYAAELVTVPMDPNPFNVGRSIFFWTTMGAVSVLRQLDVDLGLLPYPKYDKQSGYSPSVTSMYSPVTCVPIVTSLEQEDIGLLLESLSYEGNKSVTPAFYENIIKTKTARDAESMEIIEFLFGDLTYDIGNVFNFGAIRDDLCIGPSNKQDPNVVTINEKNKNKWENAIDKLMETISTHNN